MWCSGGDGIPVSYLVAAAARQIVASAGQN
jgi:hypothetical protein